MGYSLAAVVENLLRKGERVVYKFDKRKSKLSGTRSLIEGEYCDGTKGGYIVRTAVVDANSDKDARAYERLNKELGLSGVVD